ncbi:MAG: oxygen-independent coproporphyrinogen III oxidase [Lachnospiraceae bacterium]|nr:oxygen-independent coproporphyrinogen III oxidase [Lachnospiraceae bacterium]
MTKKRSLELYIHIPFCVQKCFYCDFLSFPAARNVMAEYMDQLRCEIASSGGWYENYQVQTVFIGGGTPSILESEQILMLMQTVRKAFSLAEDAEITIEANPGTFLNKKIPVYQAAGINRLSIGLQSASNGELKRLGRIHSFEDFLKSFQSARMEGFGNINIDLISAVPGQTIDSWRNTLKKVIMLKPEHISAYSLMIEEGTVFGEHYQKEGEGYGLERVQKTDKLAGWPDLPNEDEERQMYELTKKLLADAGFIHYEISNFAKPGYQCRHNLGYWSGIEYLGFGLGASSCVKGQRFCNETDLENYQKLDFSLDGLERLHGRVHIQSRREQMEEFMFLGLRKMEGVTELEFIREFGIRMDSVYGDVIRKLTEERLIERKASRIALTDRGIDVSNYVFGQFLLDMEF